MARFWIPKALDENGNLTNWQGKLTGVFDDITIIGDSILANMFRYCTGATTINFPNLTKIEYGGLEYAFRGCTRLTKVSFPKLTSVGDRGLSGAFASCSGIKEIHFRADAESVIKSAHGYSGKFGASNATIYFDL